nr:transposase family protein [Streptomyces griseoviridis]
MHYRTNLTVRRPAPLFGVSPATVCRVFQRLGPLLGPEPARTSQEAVECCGPWTAPSSRSATGRPARPHAPTGSRRTYGSPRRRRHAWW